MNFTYSLNIVIYSIRNVWLVAGSSRKKSTFDYEALKRR